MNYSWDSLKIEINIDRNITSNFFENYFQLIRKYYCSWTIVIKNITFA